jgi:GT2 family glycosyltransferase
VSLPEASVVIPSIGRPAALVKCLRSLANQSVAPRRIIVVWQADDIATRDAVLAMGDEAPAGLELVHSPEANMVGALNAGMSAADTDIILRTDDDTIVPPDWVERHLAFYRDPTIGAVGGPYDNFRPDGSPFVKRAPTRIGELTWYGKTFGNIYDQVPAMRELKPRDVNHVNGNNLSLRRGACGKYDRHLRPYWQDNELDICLQVKAHGHRVVFDFANVVLHHPTSNVAEPGRGGDLNIKIFNGAYNRSFVLSKHSPPHLRGVRLLYILMVGSVAAPGLAALPIAIKRYGRPARELRILFATWKHNLAGWGDGARVRAAAPPQRTACESQ